MCAGGKVNPASLAAKDLKYSRTKAKAYTTRERVTEQTFTKGTKH